MANRQKVYKVYSCFLEGITGIISEIEVSITPGIPTFDVIGLCDSSIRESRGRIQAALRSSGYDVPKGHITVSISPAYMRKSGSNMDLAIALGILISSGQVGVPEGAKIFAEGELSLIGNIKQTPGAALRLAALGESGQLDSFTHIFVPEGEILAAQINNMVLMPVDTIKEACDGILWYSPECFSLDTNISKLTDEISYLDELKGQEKAKRGILIAASGFHNLLLLGSPGSGKSMAAKMIGELMPPLTPYEAGRGYAITDASGKGDLSRIIGKRPFRYIHQTITLAGLLGKGINLAPGEVTLANNGILYVDEILEFRSSMLDSLREPMENREVKLMRDNQTYIYPANFLFVGAGNPCRCGFYLDDSRKCRCTPVSRKNYFSKLSGPFLDRVDIFAELRVPNRGTMEEIAGVKSIRSLKRSQKKYEEIVRTAWDMQEKRFGFDGKSRTFNANVNKVDSDLFRASSEVVQYAGELAENSGLTGRGFSKLMRVGRTIADMNNSEDLLKEHISEASIFKIREFI